MPLPGRAHDPTWELSTSTASVLVQHVLVTNDIVGDNLGPALFLWRLRNVGTLSETGLLRLAYAILAEAASLSAAGYSYNGILYSSEHPQVDRLTQEIASMYVLDRGNRATGHFYWIPAEKVDHVSRAIANRG